MKTGGRRLTQLVSRFAKVRVLVVGDLMIDHFVWGRVERISPEAPVPVVRVTKESVRPGGAGNVATNVAALGGRPTVAGIVGRDEAGKRLVGALQAMGSATDGLVFSRDAVTIQKTRVIAHHQQLARLDREEDATIDGPAARKVRDAVLGRRGRYDVLVISDYGKGTIGPELLHALAEAHRKKAFIWLVDPKRANYEHYKRASLVKPNREEAAAAAGVDIRDGASLREAGRRLLSRLEAESVLISCGDEGLALFKPGGVVRQFPTAARQVFDVTGAGDTVMATLALALGAGGTLEEATVLANHAAGVVVGKVGTETVSAAELHAALPRK